ncbi:hypothetical protein EYF80_064024 [Liparis tanakae]|uniref:Uncharacterized protein n=1 Tax=Liparis tanakae TaxID=230148 RepID=A0A4Z2EBC6_9TELE|nr:hypothetical protein EYF80_064024 [Liparis tanakae]
MTFPVCMTDQLPCSTARLEGGGASYSVPEFKATDCDYDWTNDTVRSGSRTTAFDFLCVLWSSSPLVL